MTKLELYSEPFARTGNIAGEGSKRLLGSPTLGILPTVIREALQNSLDASVEIGAPKILIRVRSLSQAELGILREHVISSLPAAESSSRGLINASLSGESIKVFEICDYGTSGLGGPIRADLPVQDGEEPDFVNFIRNVGVARDTHHGGGTYGYGKTSLYAMSKCAAILVDTESTHRGARVRRLIGCHLGDAYDGNGRRYTGRHWWGVPDESDGVDPLEGTEAESLSLALGMPERAGAQSGTSIMIIDPCFSQADQIGGDLIEAILWNFWPRMTETTPPHRRLTVAVEIEGKVLEMPKPENFPPLDLFSAAIADLRDEEKECEAIRCGNPAKDLGKVVIHRGIVAQRHPAACRDRSCVPSQSALIALMRPVELVVKYLPGEPFADSSYEWAGVFICSDDDEVENAFADSEPPAHDDWISDKMPRGRAKTFVKVGMRELKRKAGEYSIPKAVRGTVGQNGPSLAQSASLLGKHLMQSSSQGPGVDVSGSGSRRRSGGRGRVKTGLSQPVFDKLEVDHDGSLVSRFTATLRNEGNDPSLVVCAEPYLVADGGSTTTDDLGDDFKPVIREMRFRENHEIYVDGCRLKVGEEEGNIEVAVSMPNQAAIGLRLRLESADKS
jgi:hypothetical protein